MSTIAEADIAELLGLIAAAKDSLNRPLSRPALPLVRPKPPELTDEERKARVYPPTEAELAARAERAALEVAWRAEVVARPRIFQEKKQRRSVVWPTPASIPGALAPTATRA